MILIISIAGCGDQKNDPILQHEKAINLMLEESNSYELLIVAVEDLRENNTQENYLKYLEAKENLNVQNAKEFAFYYSLVFPQE